MGSETADIRRDDGTARLSGESGELVRSDQPATQAGLRDEIVRGLLYIHSRLNANTGEALEALSVVGAVVDLLCKRGLITAEELEASRQEVGRRLAAQFDDKGLGILLQENEEDKYAFKGEVAIDCASRISLCRAACCRLTFALSKQDVREGTVQWNLEKPYVIARGRDGYCTHLERNSMGCGIWKSRPVPCRAFDCRKDARIWIDFEKRIPRPDLGQPDWPRCVPHDHDREDKSGHSKVVSLQRGDEMIPL
jgi:putative zinc- or iron-chelating protein